MPSCKAILLHGLRKEFFFENLIFPPLLLGRIPVHKSKAIGMTSIKISVTGFNLFLALQVLLFGE